MNIDEFRGCFTNSAPHDHYMNAVLLQNPKTVEKSS